MTDCTLATYCVALLGIPGAGRRTAPLVLQRFPDASSLLGASAAELASLTGVPLRVREHLQQQVQARLHSAADTVRAAEDQGVTVATRDTPWFAERLAVLPDPPVALFVRGDPRALTTRGVAVIGSRTPTPAGTGIARRVTALLVHLGYSIVSGLAVGVDGAAHETALDAGGRTVAFLPSALDRIYPPANEELAKRIAQNGGALVSEYLSGTPPRRANFIARDRLQAGQALALVAVQSEVTGGTMHTVRFALELGRKVYCPQPPWAERDEAVWQGVAALLADGRATALDPASLQTLREELG